MKKGIAIGLGVAAASAAAYLIFGPNGRKNREKIKGWVLKMREEIIDKLEDLEEVTQDVYDDIVDTVAARYEKAKDIDKEELKDAIEDIKRHWRVISKGPKKRK